MKNILFIAQRDLGYEGLSKPVFATQSEDKFMAFLKGVDVSHSGSTYCSLIDIDTGKISEYTCRPEYD